jgi:glycogen phosphorylase
LAHGNWGICSTDRAGQDLPIRDQIARPSSESADPLAELALDLRNCWDYTTHSVWSRIDPELWDLTHNPWLILQTASRRRIEELNADPQFRAEVGELARARRESLKRPAWFQQAYPKSPLSCVAFFSMEYALSEALPIYSGGLGNVAGDYLKAGSDLAVPLVGVGLLYQQGYFRQILEADGTQRALNPYNDPGQLPVTPVRNGDGEWIRLNINLPGHRLWLRAWEVQVGRLKLYLLDSNDLANQPAYRGITSELYGGGPELRLTQELVLGIGGWRMLQSLGMKPEVCHLNEGHAAFVVLERARSFMAENGVAFDVALSATRVGNLFTTHTPVAAGFDRFAPSLIGGYLSRYARELLQIDLSRLLALGREHPDDPDEPFSMAYLAIRGCGAINGVSRLHAHVSRRIFQSLFPRWPEAEVPVGYVTNGVHTPTWDSAAADSLWTKACGHERWRGTMETVGTDLKNVSDAELWELRATNRLELVAYVRGQLATELEARGEDPSIAQSVFDPNTLTLGFARRFASYKRPNQLLHNPERLVRILTNQDRPVQLVIAGKAHPDDKVGQALVQAWVRFVRRPDVRRHAVFLSDYDLLLAERLVQGADLWINTPRRPWEASGTSGMKVLVNGGLNLSELDGWWAEAYVPEAGWALGDGNEHGDDPAWDAAEADAMYELLEQQVGPAFYTRDRDGIPTRWLSMMRESMTRLTPQFSANRAVREYTDRYYVAAATAYGERSRDRGSCAQSLLAWRAALLRHWADVRFGELQVSTSAETHHFQVQVYLGDLTPDQVRVELYAGTRDAAPAILNEMTRGSPLPGSAKAFTYSALAPASRPPGDYTPRVVAWHPDARIPLEDSHILWFR